MPMPPKKEKRTQTYISDDGVIREVEVEVEIPNPMKRLFLFPEKDISNRDPVLLFP